MRKHKLKNCPEWLLEADTFEEDIELISGVVIWIGGVWNSGIWKGGFWNGGSWNSGIWKGGNWHGGNWRGGYWHGGNWYGGYWHGGYWSGGNWHGGNWHGGNWHGGYWSGGNWHGGNWNGGVWRGGYWIEERVLFTGSIGPMQSSGRTVYYIFTKSHEYVRAGCFSGTIAELRKRAKAEGKEDYLRLCTWLRRELNARKKEASNDE